MTDHPLESGHPLTDEKCNKLSIFDLDECSAAYAYGIMADMRAAYDLGESKGRAEMLDDVLEWLGKNLSNPKYSDISEEHKIISGQVEQFSYIITDAIQDDLLEAMSPQEES